MEIFFWVYKIAGNICAELLAASAEASGIVYADHFRSIYRQDIVSVRILQECGWTLGPVWIGTEHLFITGFRTLNRTAHRCCMCRLQGSGLCSYAVCMSLTSSSEYSVAFLETCPKRCLWTWKMLVYNTHWQQYGRRASFRNYSDSGATWNIV